MVSPRGQSSLLTLGSPALLTERQECGEAKAERLVQEELARLQWTESELLGRRKGDDGKVRIAWRLRRETR
jgi:hypothetical protein